MYEQIIELFRPCGKIILLQPCVVCLHICGKKIKTRYLLLGFEILIETLKVTFVSHCCCSVKFGERKTTVWKALFDMILAGIHKLLNSKLDHSSMSPFI